MVVRPAPQTVKVCRLALNTYGMLWLTGYKNTPDWNPVARAGIIPQYLCSRAVYQAVRRFGGGAGCILSYLEMTIIVVREVDVTFPSAFLCRRAGSAPTFAITACLSCAPILIHKIN